MAKKSKSKMKNQYQNIGTKISNMFTILKIDSIRLII